MHNVCESLAFTAQKTEESVTNGLPVGTCGCEVAIIVRACELARQHTYHHHTRQQQGAPKPLGLRASEQRTAAGKAGTARKRSKRSARPILLADIVRRHLQLLRVSHVQHLLYVPALLRVRGAHAQAQEARGEEEPPVRRRHLGPQRERRHRRPHPLHQGAELPRRAHRRVRHRRQLHRRHGRRGPRGRRHRLPPPQRQGGGEGLRARLRLPGHPRAVR